MKKAIIIGSSGQDGSILFTQLKDKNYSLIGIDREECITESGKYKELINILDKEQMSTLIADYTPDEIYHLAAYHHSSEEEIKDEAETYKKSHQINTVSLGYILDAVKKFSPQTRVFYASSAHVFNPEHSEQQNEETPLEPKNIYGVTKANSMLLCKYYRQEHKIYACSGIFYNHNSVVRSPKFLLMKIIKTALEIQRGEKEELVIGDLTAKIDIGYAPDYMEAAQHIMQEEKAEDYIISSGALHTVQEIVEEVFKQIGLDLKGRIREDNNIIKRKQKPYFGDRTKLLQSGWQQKTSFQEMISIIITSEKNKA